MTNRRRYSVKSIFFTLQGEGYNTGRRAVFCRFSGCNLWNGEERDRGRAVCRFCDTDFVGVDGDGGGRFTRAEDLGDAILKCWPGDGPPFVVFTGGEPTLQLDDALLTYLKSAGVELAIETNGTKDVPSGLDWICVSPKADAILRQRTGNELKIAWPQPQFDLSEMERLDFDHFYLQPIDGPALQANIAETVAVCQERPNWKISWQAHKLLGIP